MSEVVISGNVAVTKAPAPIKVDMPPPVAPAETIPQDSGDIRLKRISDPIESGEDGRGLREEVRRQQREADPIYEWKADAAMPEPGPSESWGKQLRRASESQYEARLSTLAQDLQQVPGATSESARRAAEFMADPPPIKVVPVSDAGQFLPPLLDDQPVSAEHEGFRNMAEASRAMKNYRDLEDRQRQALADELTQRQAQEIQAAEQAQAQQAQVKAQEQEAARAQQAQAAHVAAAAQAQQQAAALQQVRQMSLNEAELAARIQRHDEWATRNFPELSNADALAHMAETNPARLQQLQQEHARNNAARAQLAKHQQERQVREYALGQHLAQQAASKERHGTLGRTRLSRTH
jgi:hypothetical protein